MEDGSRISEVIDQVRPDEIYNLASQSHVVQSWDQPAVTLDINLLGLIRILEAVRHLGLTSTTRVLNVGAVYIGSPFCVQSQFFQSALFFYL